MKNDPWFGGVEVEDTALSNCERSNSVTADVLKGRQVLTSWTALGASIFQAWVFFEFSSCHTIWSESINKNKGQRLIKGLFDDDLWVVVLFAYSGFSMHVPFIYNTFIFLPSWHLKPLTLAELGILIFYKRLIYELWWYLSWNIVSNTQNIPTAGEHESYEFEFFASLFDRICNVFDSKWWNLQSVELVSYFFLETLIHTYKNQYTVMTRHFNIKILLQYFIEVFDKNY